MSQIKEAYRYFAGKSYWTVPNPPLSHFIRCKIYPRYSRYTTKEFNQFFRKDYGKDIPLFDDVPLDEFLLDSQHQRYFFENIIDFFKEPSQVYSLLYELKHLEKRLIDNHFLKENHSFYENLITHIDFLLPKDKQEILQFCTMMYLEDNSIHPHWNFKHLLNKSKIDEIITIELHKNILGFNFLFDAFSLNELNEASIIIPKTPYPKLFSHLIQEINIKDYYTALFLNEKFSFASYETLMSKVNSSLNLSHHLDVLSNIIQTNKTPIYTLNKLNLPELNQFKCQIELNKKMIPISIETLCKFHTMEKTLSKLIHLTNNNYPFAGLGEHKLFDIDAAIQHFSQDKELLPYMIDFLQLKAHKALKNDIKSKWRYFHLNIDLIENKQSTTSKFKI